MLVYSLAHESEWRLEETVSYIQNEHEF